MKAQFTASRSFTAATRPEPDSGSDRLIIKAYRVRITVTGEAMTVYHDADRAIGNLVQELDGRVLEDMMPGAATTLLGIAAWTMERLATPLGKLIRVEVLEERLLDADGGSVVVERDFVR